MWVLESIVWVELVLIWVKWKIWTTRGGTYVKYIHYYTVKILIYPVKCETTSRVLKIEHAMHAKKREVCYEIISIHHFTPVSLYFELSRKLAKSSQVSTIKFKVTPLFSISNIVCEVDHKDIVGCENELFPKIENLLWPEESCDSLWI